MPTFLEQFADAEIKVRYKEPLLTAGLDQMLTGITPQGVHRGFRLAPNIGNLKVTVEADPADNDHIAAYTTDDGYTLRLRRTGGDFDLDLSPFINKEVVIAIFAEYGTGVTTFAEIRAYEYDPVDEFTGAAERGELVVLGKVTVPAAGVIPVTDIDPTFRTLAWDHVGSDAAPWEQVIENGSFELAADAASFVAADRGFVPHWDTQYILPQHSWGIDSVNPHTGRYCLKMTGTGVASLSVVPPDRIVAVQPGQLIRVSYWVRGENWPVIGAGGTMGLQLNFFGPNLSLLSFRVVQDKSLTGTFGWTQLDEYIEVPAGVAWMVPAITILDSPVAGVTAALAFDDIRVWMSKGPPTIPYSSVQDGLTNGGHVVGQLGIAETNVTQFGITQDLESFVKGILALHKLDNVAGPGVNRYKWSRLDEEPFNLRLVEGSVHSTGLVGTTDEAEYPRFAAESPDPLVAAWANILEVTSALSGSSVPAAMRRLGWLTSTHTKLYELLNARRDLTLGQHVLDDPAQDAAEFTVAASNGGGAVVGLSGHAAADGTPFLFMQPLWAVYGDPTAAAPNCHEELRDGYLNFPLVTAALSNRVDPGMDNILCSANIVKAWAHFHCGGGAAAIDEAYGISSIVYDATSPVLNFHRTMDSSEYVVVINSLGDPQRTGQPFNLTTTGFSFRSLYHSAVGAHSVDDFSLGGDIYFLAIVIGRQS